MLSALIQSRLRYPAVRLAAQLVNRRSVHHGPLVLVTAPLKTPTPTIDRDRTVSRRSEPSSRATLMGEQPNPWDLLQPQDVTSRHRGAKPPRRYELLGGISLLSPEYLLSFERRSFHTHPPDHYAPVSCLLGMSASQSSALMPLHSLRSVTNRPEGTFGSLRYAFGGDHPSQTTHQAMSSIRELEFKQTKGRISTAAPQILAYLLHCLRPILHIACPNSMLSYSKGSRGLFVPSRVIGIFTDTTISLSSWLRQCPDHYTIRAGRNLPDKEFRYLRTVIVTAAVYRGFNSMLPIASDISS